MTRHQDYDDHHNARGDRAQLAEEEVMNRNKMPFGLIVMFAIGLVLAVGPLVAPATGFLNGFVISVLGLIVMLVTGAMIIFTRLYRKATAYEAFVRTGFGGSKAVIDGGAVVLPVLHEVVPVTLRTIPLSVARTGPDALITGDKLRADVQAEFYVKVNKEEAAVLTASTSLGVRAADPRLIQELVNEKLINALRDVAATKTLNDLNSDRKGFAQAVQEAVHKDLEANGLSLESVTISKLDQTPLDRMNPEQNIFDAEGARTIARIVQDMRVQRTTIQVAADKEVKAQEVARDQELARLDVTRTQAQSRATAEQQIAQAEADREARERAAAEQRKATVAEVEKDQAVAVANVKRGEAVAVAEKEKAGAEQAAQIKADQTVQVANEQKQTAVERAAQERAMAAAERSRAEAEAEEARQAVVTVTAVQTAERDKKAAVIAKQSIVEQEAIEQRTRADVDAYRQVTTAEGEQKAAEKKAVATRTVAEAEKDAETLRAEGRKAQELIPVQVNDAQVEVDRKRVEVMTSELKAKSDHAAISKELEIALATISADKDARIALAQAMGQALAAANLTIWGDPDAVKTITGSFNSWQSTGMAVSGLLAGLPDGSAANIGKVGAALVKKFTGIDVAPEVVENFVRAQVPAGGKAADGVDPTVVS